MVSAVFAGHPGVARKHVLSHSISDKYSLEGVTVSVLSSAVTALLLFWVLGLAVFGPMCGPLRAALKLNPSLRDQCTNNSQCLFCEGSFVGMGWTEHLFLGTLLALQSVWGRLTVELVIKAHSFKMAEWTVQGGQAGNNVLWMRKCSPFIFAFAVPFYYLL